MYLLGKGKDKHTNALCYMNIPIRCDTFLQYTSNTTVHGSPVSKDCDKYHTHWPTLNSSSPFDPYLIFLPFLPSILDMLDLLTLPCPDNGVIIMPVTAGERKQSLFFNICHMLGNIFSFSK